MSNQRKKYAVMYIPEDGLFYERRAFRRANGDLIPFKYRIPVFASYKAATKYRYNGSDRHVVVSVEIIDHKGN